MAQATKAFEFLQKWKHRIQTLLSNLFPWSSPNPMIATSKCAICASNPWIWERTSTCIRGIWGFAVRSAERGRFTWMRLEKWRPTRGGCSPLSAVAGVRPPAPAAATRRREKELFSHIVENIEFFILGNIEF